MNDKGSAKTLRLCREDEDHSREKLAEVVQEINHTRRIYDWAYVNCFTAYYDIHGLWIAVNSEGHMLGHGATKLEALEKAQQDRLIRWRVMDSSLPDFKKVLDLMNRGNQ